MPDRFLNSIADGIRPDQVITYTEWADTYFCLPRESSSEYGHYRSSRTPFVREILNELSPTSPTQIVVLQKPTQLAATTVGLVFLCAMMDISPGPALFIGITDSKTRSFSRKKLTPAIKATERLRNKIKEPRVKDSGNTILEKTFPGGNLLLAGSNSGASYRSESIKNLVLDDFDGFALDIEQEGSPDKLADRRTGTFPDRKIYINSTPTTKGASNIERSYERSSQGKFCVPCPRCGAYQYLQWGGRDADFGIKFARDASGLVIDAWYVCEACHGRIDEHEKSTFLEAGMYIHDFPERPIRGFKYNALYTPLGWVNTWKYIAQEFLDAQLKLKRGDPTDYKVWLNTLMAECYEDKGDQPDWAILKARCEPYEMLTVPDKARLLTAGTDVQHNRLAVSIWAWGPGEECWLVYHVEIAGDVLQPEVWEQHDMLVLQRTFFQVLTRTQFHVISAGVDAGDGQTTQAVRNYCRTRRPRVFALKGASSTGRPVIGIPTKQDVTWKGEKIENGVEMWPIGTDTAKATLYGRLANPTPGAGYAHFYIGLQDEYFEQLTAEKIVTRFVKGYPVREWHNVRGNKRNEALDCFVYAYAAAIRVGLPFMGIEKKSVQRPPEPPPKGAPNLFKGVKTVISQEQWFGRR